MFKRFSVGEDDKQVDSVTAGTMNMQEFISMLAHANLIDNKLTNREAREIFVQVNLDDELFEQEDEENNASELVYDEFVECIVRVAFEKLGDEVDWEGLDDRMMTPEAMVDKFIRGVILPLAPKKKKK